MVEKKTKDYYSLIISNKAQLPCNAKNSKRDCLQYKVLNSILYTNAKRFKILDISSMTKVLFCKTEQETLCHFLFHCQHSNMLWKNVEQYYITITKEFHALYLREVIIVITKCPLLNYLILIGKLHLWDCRKKQVIPNMEGFKFKVRIK